MVDTNKAIIDHVIDEVKNNVKIVSTTDKKGVKVEIFVGDTYLITFLEMQLGGIK